MLAVSFCSSTTSRTSIVLVDAGIKVGQVALRFGANDMGSIMIEENVVSAAARRMRRMKKCCVIDSEAGFIPQQATFFIDA